MIVAVLDACVLYPPSLRDLFMWLAATIVYQTLKINGLKNLATRLQEHPESI